MIKCSVCKRPVAHQWREGGHFSWLGISHTVMVAAPHPGSKKGKLCDGSGAPERTRK